MANADAPGEGRAEGAPGPRRASLAVRLLASLAVLVVAATYVAAQADLLRRHRPGIAPGVYWTPQLLQIWLPGLAAAAALGGAAFVLHRRARAK